MKNGRWKKKSGWENTQPLNLKNQKINQTELITRIIRSQYLQPRVYRHLPESGSTCSCGGSQY